MHFRPIESERTAVEFVLADDVTWVFQESLSRSRTVAVARSVLVPELVRFVELSVVEKEWSFAAELLLDANT